MVYGFMRKRKWLIIADDGKKTWVIASQFPTSHYSQSKMERGRTDSNQTGWKMHPRFDVLEPDLPDLMWMICNNYEHDWVRIHTPTPLLTADWSGTWTQTLSGPCTSRCQVNNLPNSTWNPNVLDCRF